MNQSNYDVLLTRINVHCQHTARYARSDSGWPRDRNGYTRWYNPDYKTCLVLKPEEDGQDPAFAFLPARQQQIKETEQQLGFPLPPLLRLLYTQIANGGFGPGYGIIGIKDGYPGVNHIFGNIARRYQWEIDFANALRQQRKGGWPSLTPEEREVLWQDGIGSQELWGAEQLANNGTEEEIAPYEECDLIAPWPKQLLPLCEHGCNITTYIFANTEQIVQGMHGPDLIIATSLEEWLELWLAGEELQLM